MPDDPLAITLVPLVQRESGALVAHPLASPTTVRGWFGPDRSQRLVLTVEPSDEAKVVQALEDARHARVLLPGQPPQELAYLGFRLRARGGRSIPRFMFGPPDQRA
jgi:hypothetical protein